MHYADTHSPHVGHILPGNLPPGNSTFCRCLEYYARSPLIAAKYAEDSVCREAKIAKTILPVCSHYLSLALSLSPSLPLSDEVWKMQTNFLARSRKFSSFFFVFAVPITFWKGSKYSAKGSRTRRQSWQAEGVASCKFVMRKSYKTWVFRVLTKSN